MNQNNVNYLHVSNVKENYLDHIPEMNERDLTLLRRKDKEYDKAWVKSYDMGLTQGVFQLIYEKFQRIQTQCKKSKFDLFEAVKADQREEGILDDIRDLRRYLLLIEAELINREIVDINKVSYTLTSGVYTCSNMQIVEVENDDEEQVNTEHANDKCTCSGMKNPFGYQEDEDNN